MRTSFAAALILLFVTTAGIAAAPPTASTPPPGGIRLPEGFRHERLQGIDSIVGRISKEGGLAIEYDLGKLAGNYAASIRPEDRAWTIKQQVNNEAVEIVKGKDGRVTATFARQSANFFAKINNEEDLATFLSIVLTYPDAPARG